MFLFSCHTKYFADSSVKDNTVNAPNHADLSDTTFLDFLQLPLEDLHVLLIYAIAFYTHISYQVEFTQIHHVTLSMFLIIKYISLKILNSAQLTYFFFSFFNIWESFNARFQHWTK